MIEKSPDKSTHDLGFFCVYKEANRMIQLAFNHVQKSYGVFEVLQEVSFEVQDFERVGIVGRNGTGKTTLLKIAMGIETQDAGDVFWRKEATRGYVEQIPYYDPDFTVLQVLQTAFEKQYALKAKMEELEVRMSQVEEEKLEKLLKQYGEVAQQFEVLGGYEIEEKIAKVTSGLGIKQDFLSQGFNVLSGGEKTTVLLGKVLLQNPDVLLLDEPTNHLDMQAVEWLEEYLKQYRGAVVMVAHDRYFLDQVATKIVNIEAGKATTYLTNYSDYVKEKEKQLEEAFEAYKDQQKKIKAMEQAIKRLRQWATQGDNEDLYKRAAAMQKRLDRIEKLDRPRTDQSLQLDFRDEMRSGSDVLRLKAVDKAFGEQVLFKEASFELNYQERVVLIGKNGCGKSTLIKMILGEESIDAGEIVLGTRLKMAYLPQQVTFKDENLTVLETLRENLTLSEEQARHILAKFFFYGGQVFKKVKDLSGGEKSRLRLCELMQQDVNLLILDEPTNHLDIESRESLEEALMSFKGTILAISHDRFFINKIASRVSRVADYTITSYLGNYEDYKAKRAQQKLKEQEAQMLLEKEQNLKIHQKSGAKKNYIGQQGKLLGSSLSQIKDLEDRITLQEKKVADLEAALIKEAEDYIACGKLEAQRQMAQAKLDDLLEEWLKLESMRVESTRKECEKK